MRLTVGADLAMGADEAHTRTGRVNSVHAGWQVRCSQSAKRAAALCPRFQIHLQMQKTDPPYTFSSRYGVR